MTPINILYALLAPISAFSYAWAPTDSSYLFRLQDTYIGDEFFDGFDFVTFDDPTHGRVNYVSRHTSIRNNLSYASDDKFFMRADDQNVVSPEERGRDSIRIQSREAYSDSIVVLDLSHMPEGCSTWPAFWTNSAKGPWPHGGEIDGVNNDVMNLASQHTTSGCTMPPARPMTGQSTSTNCDAAVNFNQGCGVRFNSPDSYGALFNYAGGGWYVLHRTADDGASVWFWPRYDATVPPAVKYGEPWVQPDQSWRLPDAYFPTTSCSDDHFDAHHIIFDLTFCGDWAGSAYGNSGCPGNCNDFVENNPSEFSKAYWEINSLRIYTPF